MIYVISKATFGSYNVRDIQCNANWDCCPYSDYALIPDSMVEGILATKGYCDITLNSAGTEVASFTARTIPSVEEECCGTNTVLSVNGKTANTAGEVSITASDVGAAPVDSVGTNKVFKKLTDIGITAFPTTMSIVASKMPNNSTLIIDSRDIISGGANEISDLGVSGAGTYMIMRGNTTSRVQLLHIYGAATAATSFVEVGNYAVTPNTVTWVRALDNSDSNYGTASANNDYHTAYFTKIGRFVSCTLLPKVAGTTAIYQEDITMPTGYYPAANTTFTIYTTSSGSGNATVRAYANGILRVMRADGVSVAESSKTYCWVTA